MTRCGLIFDKVEIELMSHSQLSAQQDRVALPPRMTSALKHYRKQVWFIKVAEAVLAAIFGLAMSYLAVFACDRLWDTPAIVRTAILALGSVGMVILFPLKYHNWVWSHRRLDQVARLVRHKFPRFGDHLLGIVELAHSESQHGKSRALVQAAMRQVDQELQKRDLSDAIPNPRHRRWAWAAGVPLLLIAGLMVLIPAAGGNALKRWLLPWSDVERYTFAQLAGKAELRVVPYAEPFEIHASLQSDSPWKPDSATARYGAQSVVGANRDGQTYRFEMRPQTADGTVSIRVGDAFRVIPVQPKLRPTLNALFAEVRLPDYLQRSEPMMEDVRGGTVNLVKGSTAIFKAVATRELAYASLNDRSQFVEGPQVTTERFAVSDSREYRLAWRDVFGLQAREPQILRVEAREDGPPTVSIGQLKNNQVLLSTTVVAFEIQVGDDFGVKRVGLQWRGIHDPLHNPQPNQGEKIVAAGRPTDETLTVAATFGAQREQVRPQSLRVRAFAEDYFPDRQRAYSPEFVLHVLTPAEHYKWLIDQLSQWTGAAQEVYEKELQLHQVNDQLMKLPPEALDDPAQKKTIQDQAAAEKANAAKLAALLEVGKTLVKEAAKNEEFDPEQLEALAELLKQLEEIAGVKMPSVAELLQQAADAPGAELGEPAEEPPLPGEPGEAQKPEKPNPNPPEKPIAVPPGGQDLGLEKAKKYGPDGLEIEGLDRDPEDPNKPGGEVNVDKSKQPEGKPGYVPANPTPLVLDFESGFNKAEKAEDAPQIKGGLGIPVTVLKGSGTEPEEEPPPATTAELVLQAVSEQQELLDAFAKLASEMNQLLLGFENSTFVKRLKAASRRQMDLAVELNSLDGFGVGPTVTNNVSQRKILAKRQVAESETVATLQEDLVTFAERRPSRKFTRVVEQMQQDAAVTAIRKIGGAINANTVGQSTIESEYWADTLDRYAEQLVDPLVPHPPPPAGVIDIPNLTPAIVMEVLRVINREIELREETRELQQARAALVRKEYEQRGRQLSTTQAELAKISRDLVDQIMELPRSDHPHIVKQINKLLDAAEIMDEVEQLLAKPETGPETMAAIQDVIETLLETGRLPNAPMVVKAPPATASALLLMGLGDDGRRAFIENRAPDQATGKSGRKLPEEFRQGLDAYLNALEGR